MPLCGSSGASSAGSGSGSGALGAIGESEGTAALCDRERNAERASFNRAQLFSPATRVGETECERAEDPTSGSNLPRRPTAAATPGHGALVVVIMAAALMTITAAGVMSFEIHGKVQGVFFRKHTQAEGARLKLKGWCENTRAGTVRGEFHGDAAAVEKFQHWLSKKGSPKSRIEKADFSTSDKDPSELPFPFAIVK